MNTRNGKKKRKEGKVDDSTSLITKLDSFQGSSPENVKSNVGQFGYSSLRFQNMIRTSSNDDNDGDDSSAIQSRSLVSIHTIDGDDEEESKENRAHTALS